MPRSDSIRMNASTCIDCRTPSAAAGSSMITMWLPHVIARATAIIWRCPPESAATGLRGSTWSPSDPSCSRVDLYIADLFSHPIERPSGPRASTSRLRKKLCITSRVSTSGEVLVHGLDAEAAGELGRERLLQRAVDVDLAGVRAVRAGDALDERRLAGAVVADEPEDLARVQREADVAERADGAVRLRRRAQLDDRARRAHRAAGRPAALVI